MGALLHRKRKVDANQKQIVRVLKAAGATVQDLSGIGKGCPDLLVGHGGRNYLFEVKNPESKPSDRKLTKAEDDWHRVWVGEPVYVIETSSDALRAIGLA